MGEYAKTKMLARYPYVAMDRVSRQRDTLLRALWSREMKELTPEEYRKSKTRYPAKDKQTALATGVSKYYSKCKLGHEIRYKSGGCVECTRLRNIKRDVKRHPELAPSDTMSKIERLKDARVFKKLIGDDDEW